MNKTVNETAIIQDKSACLLCILAFWDQHKNEIFLHLIFRDLNCLTTLNYSNSTSETSLSFACVVTEVVWGQNED